MIDAGGLDPDEANNAQLLAAIRLLGRQPVILTDTGVAGTYSAVNVPPLTALPGTGFVQRVKIANANLGAATYSPDGLAARPIYGLGLQALQGGELTAGVAVLMYLVQAGVNGGNGAWIIIESLGGAQQIPTASQSQHAARLGQVQSGSRVTGFTGNNNSGTPASQFDFSALSVTVRNPITGATAVINNPGSLTNNLLTAGPAANGRDQAGAFAASTWVHFYYIWNGTTLATIASTAQPTAGPTLPSGYTSWAYIGPVYYGSGSALASGNFRGSWFSYAGQTNAVVSGTSTGLVGVAIPTLVPPNALQFEIGLPALTLTSTTGGAYSVTCNIVTTGSTVLFTFGLSGAGTASTQYSFGGTYKRVTNIGQNFAYQIVVGAGSSPSVTITIPGYSVPNGGE